MAWCNDTHEKEIIASNNSTITLRPKFDPNVTCPSCGHNIQIIQEQGGIHELPGLPAGVKFDPNDIEILEHLEAKVMSHVPNLHPLIDEFIPTLQDENGICYTHPEKLPGVKKDGQIRHFFHRPSKAYTTGTRKRRKVHTDEDGSETRWHKTGKTRPVVAGGGLVKGFKKILVLYTNYGRQKKPEKTNWVMHQYHLGSNEEERDGELVVSKVFYQTQPRQCGNSIVIKEDNDDDLPYGKILMMNNSSKKHKNNNDRNVAAPVVDYYINYDHVDHHNHNHNSQRCSSPTQLIPNLVLQGDSSSLFRFASSSLDGNTNKTRLFERKL
ncbi:hypothetical protein HN51_057881 [Arachis hypogaea]|nr:NAC domain-containing protein [Arachis hypogaea]RYQ82527.1 hypothetical protein Ahy_B10g101113 isoform B [Arachis hypogaea]